MSGGDLAVQNGKEFQDALANWMAEISLTTVSPRGTQMPIIPYESDPLVLLEAGGSRGSRPDIWFFDPWAFRHGLMIETKYQGVSGTADQKLIWAALSLTDNSEMYPNATPRVIVGGEWWEPGKGGNNVMQRVQHWVTKYNIPVQVKPAKDFCIWFRNTLQTKGAPVDNSIYIPRFYSAKKGK
jgi:hypothetical protein